MKCSVLHLCRMWPNLVRSNVCRHSTSTRAEKRFVLFVSLQLHNTISNYRFWIMINSVFLSKHNVWFLSSHCYFLLLVFCERWMSSLGPTRLNWKRWWITTNEVDLTKQCPHYCFPCSPSLLTITSSSIIFHKLDFVLYRFTTMLTGKSCLIQ